LEADEPGGDRVSAGDDEAPLDWIARSGKRAKGKRPEFFDDPAVDRLLSMVLALTSEVSVLRERLDTVERLLEANGSLRRADIEAYVPDRAAGEQRGLATKAMITRIMRGFQQELEAMEADDPPISEWVERLSKE
jgi:hypothetical protein